LPRFPKAHFKISAKKAKAKKPPKEEKKSALLIPPSIYKGY
jgi:hypothetical protein